MLGITVVIGSALLLLNAESVYSTSIDIEPKINEGRSLKMLSDLKYVLNTYQECSVSDMATCLKVKLLKTVDRIARSDKELTLTDGVSFIKDDSAPKMKKDEVELDEAINTLPRSLNDKNEALDDLLFNKIVSFFQGHVLQVNNLKFSYFFLNICLKIS